MEQQWRTRFKKYLSARPTGEKLGEGGYGYIVKVSFAVGCS
jgi:hypothetical protein